MNGHHRHLLWVLWALLLGPATAQNYQLAPAILDLGGLRGVSSHYAMNSSHAPGIAGSSANYGLRNGFAGQLLDAISLGLTAVPATLNETATRQLAASLIFDDSTQTPLAAASVTWSVQSGPIAGIDSAGLATAGVVGQDTAAIIQGGYFGVSGSLTLTVLESIPDNSGSYIDDGLPDSWQLQFFGPGNLQGGPKANPDYDAYDNLHEYAFGIDPTNPGSGAGEVLYAAGVITRRGPPVMKVTNSNEFEVVFLRRKGAAGIGLNYLVQYSNDLGTWFDISVAQVVVAADAEMEAVKMTFPFTLPSSQSGRYFRVRVSRVP